MNDNILKTIAAEIGVDVSLGVDRPLSPKVMAELYRGGKWVDGVKWFESWKAWALQHTDLLSKAHDDGKQCLMARLSQRFSIPPLKFQLAQNDSGSGVKPAFTGVPFALLQTVSGVPQEVRRGHEARMVIDPCTMKSVTEWKLITKTQTYSTYMKCTGPESLDATLEELLERDNRKDLQFITTQDLCKGLTAHHRLNQEQQQLQYEYEGLWERETQSSLEYYGDFPLILQLGDARQFHTAHFGLIPVVKSLFPQHDLAPRASRDEILVVVGQDFIEHKPYYKYIIEYDSQDLIFDFDFLIYRQPLINYSPDSNGQVWFFVDGFCRDGAAWAVTYHKPGSWFNGVLLLNEDNSYLNDVPIALKAIWKSLMQIRDPQFCSLNANKLFSRVILYVSKQDIAAAFYNDRAMIRRWQQNGWTKPNGDPVVYRDLWEDLVYAIDSLQSLLQIEISIRYQTTGGVEVGLECLKRLKNSIPSYINLRRPNIASHIMNVTPLKTRMEFKELASDGINYRGSQCDVLLPGKLREIAKALQKEGCTSCKNDHKASCPLLSKIPSPISSEISVSRETIALHDILGPADGMKPNQLEPFGHQLCLCSPESEAMRAALSILCDTHVIMYGHNNWIAMSKAELVMSLADVDEAGLAGGMRGTRMWIDLMRSKPGGVEAYEEFQDRLKDRLRQAKKKKKGNKKKANQAGEALEKVNSKKVDEGEKNQFPTVDGMPTVILGHNKPWPCKGKEKEIQKQEQEDMPMDHSDGVVADWSITGLGEEQKGIGDNMDQSAPRESIFETHKDILSLAIRGIGEMPEECKEAPKTKRGEKSKKEKESVIQKITLGNFDTVKAVAKAVGKKDITAPKLGGKNNAKDRRGVRGDTDPMIKDGDDLLALKRQMDVIKDKHDDDVSSYTLDAIPRISDLHLDNTDCNAQENVKYEGGLGECDSSLMVQRDDSCPTEVEKQRIQRSWADIGDDEDEFLKTHLKEIGSWQKVSTRKERRKVRQVTAGASKKLSEEQEVQSGRKFGFRGLQEDQVIRSAVGFSPRMGVYYGRNEAQEAKLLQVGGESKVYEKAPKLRETPPHMSESIITSSHVSASPLTIYGKYAPTENREKDVTKSQYLALQRVPSLDTSVQRTSTPFNKKTEAHGDNHSTTKTQQTTPVELLPRGRKLSLPLPLPLIVQEEPGTRVCSGQRLEKEKGREIVITVLAPEDEPEDEQRQRETVEEVNIVYAAETMVELRPRFGDAPQWVEVRNIVPMTD